MTNLQHIARLNAQIRNLITSEGQQHLTFDPNDPIDEMWRGTEQVASGLARAQAKSGVAA